MVRKKFFSNLSRSRTQLMVAMFFSATVLAVSAPMLEQSANAARTKPTKFLVCHRTNAIKNPYRLISVAWSSVNPDNNGHDNPVHDGPVFNVANPAATHGTTPRDSGLSTEAGGGNDRWGDIFYAYKGPGNGNSNSNNWTTAGQAIFNGATFTLNGVTKPACRSMSAVDYIKAEREENPNKPMSDIMSELDEMEAGEDVALKQSLGGSFTTWFATCNQATTDCENTTVIAASVQAESPSVTTEPPSSVSTGTTTNSETATLNGTISPQGVPMVWYFEFDDDNDFTPSGSDPTDVQEVPGTPGTSNANTTVNVTYNATGLNHTKTYYYRTVGVATIGSGDTQVETYLYGVTRQFSYGAPAAPTISGISCGNTSLSVAFTAGSANGGTITNYQYSIDGGNTFTSLGTPSTISPISITGLTNGTEYNVSIRAITSTKTGADSATVAATPCGTPSSTTTAATNVQPTTATLNGHLTGNGNPLASISFTWGTSPTLASGNTTTSANTTSLLATANAFPVFANLTGLTGGTTYYFEVSGTYTNGQNTTLGGILSFTTPANVVPPTTTTDPATNVAEQSATLNGTGTSNGASSTVTFTWGTSSTLASGNTTTAAAQSPLASGASSAPVTLNLTGLTGGTTYYFRVTITNANGSANGSILSFTTPVATTTTSTTTTTTPPSSTTTVAPVVSNSVGSLEGTVWIDADEDDTKDPSEVWIPGITIALAGVSTGTTTSSSSGAFTFSNLAAGSYTVTATLPSGLGLAKSWDSQGNVDWVVVVTVVAGQTARADFAATGKIDVVGKMTQVPSGTDVNIDWSGLDKELDTTDDVTFTTKVQSDKTFTVSNVPTGKYRVRAQSIRANIVVGASGATYESSALSFIARVPTLPETGSSLMPNLVPMSLALIPAGLFAVLWSRRRYV